VPDHVPGVSIVAVPNAAKRSQWAAQRAKREGMAAGFPDILCFWKGPGVAAIEFKAHAGKLSANQIEWLDRLTEMGIPATVSRDADHAVEFLRQAGAPFHWADRGMSRLTPNQWTILESLKDGPRWKRSYQTVKPLLDDLIEQALIEPCPRIWAAPATWSASPPTAARSLA
jgi:hypothetical protein